MQQGCSSKFQGQRLEAKTQQGPFALQPARSVEAQLQGAQADGIADVEITELTLTGAADREAGVQPSQQFGLALALVLLSFAPKPVG